MKKVIFNILFVFAIYLLFIPNVDAFYYNIDISNDDMFAPKGMVVDTVVSLNSIIDTDGILSCVMDIDYDDSIVLESEIETFDNWSMKKEDSYLFKSDKPVLNKSELFKMSIKVNDTGKIKLSNISWSYGKNSKIVTDREINLMEMEEYKESDCDLVDIILSVGVLDFDSKITEYRLELDDLSNLDVTPMVSSDTSVFSIDRNEDKIAINVVAEDGTEKVYNIISSDYKDDNNESDNNYTWIFIAVIVLLVMINIYRIFKNRKRFN